ncbi:MAG: hypothetical protein EON58_02360 [Alphaproteobacteria bacterium]|nr:MAG: hypothetical protein EON58_02360 [Alphaproteobacteria bacterium]
MAFQINVQNDGQEGTVVVTERVNLNERLVVLDGFMDAGEVLAVDCRGNADKEFTWLHKATNMSGGPETLGHGDTLRVNS